MLLLHSIATATALTQATDRKASGGCQDRYETKQIGLAKKGFPVWEKTTMFGPNGAESFSTINEVVEFSQATLDPSLFDVPEGYREVKDFASAFSAAYGHTGIQQHVH